MNEMCRRGTNNQRDSVGLAAKYKHGKHKVDDALQWNSASVSVKFISWALLATARRMVECEKLVQTGEDRLIRDLARGAVTQVVQRMHGTYMDNQGRGMKDALHSAWKKLLRQSGAFERIECAEELLSAPEPGAGGRPQAEKREAPGPAEFAQARGKKRAATAVGGGLLGKVPEEDSWGMHWKTLRLRGEAAGDAKEFTATREPTKKQVQEMMKRGWKWKIPPHRLYLGPTLAGHILCRSDRTSPVYIFGDRAPHASGGKAFIQTDPLVRTLGEVAKEDYGLPLSSAEVGPELVELQWGGAAPKKEDTKKTYFVARPLPLEVLREVAPKGKELCSVQVFINVPNVRKYADLRIKYEVAFSSKIAGPVDGALDARVPERLARDWWGGGNTVRAFLYQGRVVWTTVNEVVLEKLEEVERVFSPVPFVSPLCFRPPRVKLAMSAPCEPELWCHISYNTLDGEASSDGSSSAESDDSSSESESDGSSSASDVMVS